MLLNAIFPRMAALLELDLHRNSIDDGCVQLIVCGLAECKRLLSLNLSNNRIGDSGVEVLIQGLSASVETLRLGWRGQSCSRDTVTWIQRTFPFRKSSSSWWLMSHRCVVCRLVTLWLHETRIGDEGAEILATSLRGNHRLTRMPLGVCR